MDAENNARGIDAAPHRPLDRYNATCRPLPLQGLAELFEQQVRERGGEIAVIDGPVQLTYGELNGQANRLAHYLRDLSASACSAPGS